METMELLLLIRSLGELAEVLPKVLKLLERDVAGDPITKEEIAATLADLDTAKNKWKASLPGETNPTP